MTVLKAELFITPVFLLVCLSGRLNVRLHTPVSLFEFFLTILIYVIEAYYKTLIIANTVRSTYSSFSKKHQKTSFLKEI